MCLYGGGFLLHHCPLRAVVQSQKGGYIERCSFESGGRMGLDMYMHDFFVTVQPRLSFNLKMLVALQVVFAIMSVSPHELRLSDETIAKAIVDFYKSSNVLPPGISVSALSDWAGKMAHGARKVNGKFRRLYAATPENSKDPALRDLKFRCQEAGIPTAPGCDNSDKSADSRPASHEDLEEVSCSAPSWTEALKNKLLAKMKEKEAAQKQAATARPVATPSRNSHEVPKFVLDKLAEKTPRWHPLSPQLQRRNL